MGELLLFIAGLVLFLYLGTNLLLGIARRDTLSDEWREESEAAAGKSRLGRQLQTLRIDIGPVVFLLLVLLVSALIALLFLELFPDRFLLAGLAGMAVGVFGFALVRDLAAWRARRFEERLVDAIDIMQAALRGGLNPTQALAETAKALEAPVGSEFAEIGKRLRLGFPIQDATTRMVELYDSEGVRLFTQSLIATWSAGGDLASMLRSVNRIIRERVKLRLHMTGQLSGMRYSAILLAVLPYTVIPFVMWKQPVWIDTLLYHPLGPRLLLAAVLLQVLGLFWMRRILRIDR